MSFLQYFLCVKENWLDTYEACMQAEAIAFYF